MSDRSVMADHVLEIEDAQRAFHYLELVRDSALANPTMRPCQIGAIVQALETVSNLVEILAPKCPFDLSHSANCCENLTRS